MKKRVLIIGGGVAGLSAGIYGQKAGFDTEILEMHSIPGGQCTAWKRKDYTFDYCIHWLLGTSKGAMHKLWIETGALNPDTQIIDHREQSRYKMPDGNDFIIYSDIDEWQDYLIKLAPEDARSIKKMCSHMRKMAAIDYPESSTVVGKIKEYAGKAGKFIPIGWIMLKYGNMSARKYFSKMKFRNEKLRSYLDYATVNDDFSAIAFLFMLSFFYQKNAGYPIGGSLPLAKRMESTYLECGGKIRYNTKVEKVLIMHGKATGIITSKNEEFPADYIISACDLHTNALDNWRLFPPIVQVSFGVNKRIAVPWHNYRIITETGISIGNRKLSGGYSLGSYHFDPTINSEERSVFKILFESNWDLWEEMSDKEYKNEKSVIASVAAELLISHIPEAKDAIDIIDVATPRTSVKYTGVYKGAYEGFLPSKNNMMKTLPMTFNNINRFYIIGQWLYPGGGLPPAAMSGKRVIEKISKKN
jgi:phytoene dehydrogenase-like protein